ncbi:unnamed protein product [Closterium sp. Naga37s-1]|nr:unnamed protein product [Closterium sp. Naga37s-1]
MVHKFSCRALKKGSRDGSGGEREEEEAVEAAMNRGVGKWEEGRVGMEVGGVAEGGKEERESPGGWSAVMGFVGEWGDGEEREEEDEEVEEEEEEDREGLVLLLLPDAEFEGLGAVLVELDAVGRDGRGEKERMRG